MRTPVKKLSMQGKKKLAPKKLAAKKEIMPDYKHHFLQLLDLSIASGTSLSVLKVCIRRAHNDRSYRKVLELLIREDTSLVPHLEELYTETVRKRYPLEVRDILRNAL